MAAVPPLLALISMAKASDNGREKSVSQKLSTAEASSRAGSTQHMLELLALSLSFQTSELNCSTA